jgi:plasmid maintenance system antidote protein VapI
MEVEDSAVERLLDDAADVPITPDLAEKLFRAGMGPTPEYWVCCEVLYRELLAQKKSAETGDA